MQTQRIARKCGVALSRVLTIGEMLMSAACRNLLVFCPEVEILNLNGVTEESRRLVSHGSGKHCPLKGAVVPIGKVLGYVEFLGVRSRPL